MVRKRRLNMAYIPSNKRCPTSLPLPEMMMLSTFAVLCMLSPVSTQCAKPCINGVNAGNCTDGGGLTCSCIIDDEVYYHGSQCETINMDIPRRTAYWYSIDFHWPDPPQIQGNYSYVYHSLPYDEHLNMSLKLFTMRENSRYAELRGLLPWQTLYTVCVINSTEAEIVYRTHDNSRLNTTYVDCIEEQTRISYALWICGWILLSIAIVLVLGGFSVCLYTKHKKSAINITTQPNVAYVI